MNIQQQTKQMIEKASQLGRFNLGNTQQHEHGGIGSRITSQPTFVYAGQINASGVPSFLPKDWSVSIGGTGSYTITHNLGTDIYVVVASAIQSTNQKALPIVEQFAGGASFEINWFTSAGAVNTGFNFVLVNVSSKATQFPIYSVEANF